jgi:heme A synthase
MKFFDYIFISWYRVYKEYESKKHNQRFRATMALLLCIVSIVALLVGIINRLYSLQLAMEFLLDHYYLVVILACASMFLTYNIYTEERIARINEDYGYSTERSTRFRRKGVQIFHGKGAQKFHGKG